MSCACTSTGNNGGIGLGYRNSSRERKDVSDARTYNTYLSQVGSRSRWESFPYLWRTIAFNNSDWTSVYLNLCKTWRRWGKIVRVLERTGSTVWERGEMYKAVAQLVILYFRKIWVVTKEMLEVLMGFHHRAD